MIPIAKPNLGNEELKNVIEAVKSTWISSKGKFIEEFEVEFAKYCGMKFGIATANGTVALHLALKASGIKKGDEVLIPDLSFIATANTVVYCNAKPVFVDSHPNYWCIDPAKIEEKITPKTKAIIPVHLYGHPCDMDFIMEIAEKYNLTIIEDAAEAHGSEYKSKKCGSFGDLNCFSFFANKLITTGEGGMCLTNNEELAEKMRILRDHGMNKEKRYWYDVIGFNYRMTNLQAAVGVAQLQKINQYIEKKKKISKWYKEGLKNFADEGTITLHPEMSWAKCTYWMYSILLNDVDKKSRDKFACALLMEGIETRPFFYPLHILPPYKIIDNSLKIAEDLSSRGLNLPSSTTLNKMDVDFIVNTIKKIIKKKNNLN